MSVKANTVLVRNLLYIREVVHFGSIRAAADCNNIKPSNLSKIISDTEEQFGFSLFCRTAHGMVASQRAIELSSQVEKLVHELSDLRQKFAFGNGTEFLRLYLSRGLEIGEISDFSGRVEYVDMPDYADVIVGSEKPRKTSGMVCVEHKIGSNIKQTIWVCAQNNPAAMGLATAILLKFRD